MRITFVLPFAGLSGGIRVIAIHAQALRQRGHEVTVVSTPWPQPPMRARLAAALGRRTLPQPETRSHLDGLDVEHHVIDRYRPVTDQDVPDADVVVATWWETAEWVEPLSPEKGAKAYFVQGPEAMLVPESTRVEATYRLPMHLITISRWLEQMLRQAYGVDEVTLAPNAVDPAQFHAPPRGKQATPTVGFVYTQTPIKGTSVAIQAIEAARQQLPSLRVVAFGPKPPADWLPLPADTDYVQNPPQDRIREVYASSDVWLCSSWAEGFCLPMLEAMACRCPVVATRVGGTVDVIEDGRNGYLVQPGDASAMAQRLIEIATLDDVAWRRMSDAALAAATAHRWRDATDAFEAGLVRAVERAAAGEIAGGVPAAVAGGVA